jgi:hypothetical protein
MRCAKVEAIGGLFDTENRRFPSLEFCFSRPSQLDLGPLSSPAPADRDVGLVDVITRLPCDLVRLFQRLYGSPFVSPIAVGAFGRAVDETILGIMSAGRVELDATGSDDDPPARQQQPCSNGGAYRRTDRG